MIQIPTIVADFQTSLFGSVNAGDTTAELTSILDEDGNLLANGTYGFTIDNDSDHKEYIVATLTETVLSAVVGISRQGATTNGFSQFHRNGAVVEITNFSGLYAVSELLSTADSFDPSVHLGYTSAPTGLTGNDFVTAAYVLSVVTGGTVFFSSQTLNVTAGESVAAPLIGYFKSADQRWYKADSSTSATYSRTRLGVFLGTATSGAAVPVQISGIAAGFTGLTPGTGYYLSTAGTITATPNVADILIGTAVTSTTILIEFGTSLQPSTKEKDFLQATTGMFVPFGSSTARTGFLLCDRSAVSRTTYAPLFSDIGTTYGSGDGSTTFNLPDGRGRMFMGAGTGTKVATFASRSSNVITVTGLTNTINNEFQTGQQVVYATSGSVITGLSNGGTYFLIRTGNLTFSLTTSLANAQNGASIISLSSDGSGIQTFTLTLTARTAGDTGGEENHAMSLTELLAHTHGYGSGAGATTAVTSGGSQSVSTSQYQTGSTGGNVAMNNTQPFFTGYWFIKT